MSYDPTQCTHSDNSATTDLLQPCATGTYAESFTIGGVTVSDTSQKAGSYIEGDALQSNVGEVLYTLEGANYNLIGDLTTSTPWASGQIQTGPVTSVLPFSSGDSSEVGIYLADFSNSEHFFLNNATETDGNAPEPSTSLLLTAGMAAALLWRLRRRTA